MRPALCGVGQPSPCGLPAVYLIAVHTRPDVFSDQAPKPGVAALCAAHASTSPQEWCTVDPGAPVQ